MERVLAFAQDRVGKIWRSPHGLGGQCVDLVELWAMGQGAIWIPGNAADLLMNARPKDFSVVRNSPSNFPLPGDIVVWGPWAPLSIGPFGHCAITLAADAHTLLTLDQNWPEGAPTAIVLHSYSGVKGWLHKR